MMMVEPSADHRMIAQMTAQMFYAFREQTCFDEETALRMTEMWLKSQFEAA